MAVTVLSTLQPFLHTGAGPAHPALMNTQSSRPCPPQPLSFILDPVLSSLSSVHSGLFPVFDLPGSLLLRAWSPVDPLVWSCWGACALPSGALLTEAVPPFHSISFHHSIQHHPPLTVAFPLVWLPYQLVRYT